MTWINFLHFYQPPNTDSFTVYEALDRSYWRLIRLFEEHPDLTCTINISGCLLARLKNEGELDFISRLKKLIERGQIEVVSSAAYHALLPLLPEKEIILQIKENEKILTDVLGIKDKPRGFFLPEMAYSQKVGKVLKEHGYSWIILDEIACDKGCGNDLNNAFVDKSSRLDVVFRNRKASGAYPPDYILSMFSKNENIETLITATDAELYGLRHEDPTGEMERVAKIETLKTKTISQFINEQKEKKEIDLRSCSWDTSEEDIKQGKPFKLWKDRDNSIHNKLWSLADFVMSLENEFKEDKNYYWYRWHLVRGLASCTFWWASARDFANVFGPYAWSPDIIERGIDDLVRAVRSLDDEQSRKYKLKAEKKYLEIKKNIWNNHWKKHWKN